MAEALTDFLLARIAEDEHDARHCKEWTDCFMCPTHERFDTARVLAECEAKRRIVERAVAAQRAADAWTTERLHVDKRSPEAEWAREGAYREVLRDLASAYADHADYDEEWKP